MKYGVSKIPGLFMIAVIIFPLSVFSRANALSVIKLDEPDKTGGYPFMQTLSIKASAGEWSEKELSKKDLSDLLWAACGVNRPEMPKYTNSSAMNAHEVDLYLFMKDGVYVYDAVKHILNPVMEGDYRKQLMMTPPPMPKPAPGQPAPSPRPPETNPPIQMIFIADISRFKIGEPEKKYEWAAIDTGIISQNISLFCAAAGPEGPKTRPRAAVDKEKIKKLLKLKDTQFVFLNHPVGYAK